MRAFETIILIAFAIVYAHTAGLYLVAVSRRRVKPEFKYFGYLCAILAVLAFGRALPLSSLPGEFRIAGATVMTIGHCAIIPPFVAFCATLQDKRSRLFFASIVYTLIGYGFIAAGAHLEYAPDGSVIRLSNFATYYVSGGVLLALYVLVDLARNRSNDVEIQRIVFAAALCILALLFDSIMGSHDLHRVQLLPHVGIFALGFVHWMLLERFRAATDTLRARREAYSESLEELLRIERQLQETEQLAAIGELSAVIAHEVRNPLAVIKNISSGLRRQFDKPETRARLLDILDEETERLQHLAFQLETFATHSKLNPSPVEVPALIDAGVRRALNEIDGTPDVDLEIVVEEGAEECLADAIHLETALIYLIRNAIDALGDGEGRTVKIIASRKDNGQSFSLVVSDDGVGMDEETLEKATQPFFTTKPRGSGLALTIVDRVAKNHQGSLRLESAPQKGTRAELLIPQFIGYEGSLLEDMP